MCGTIVICKFTNNIQDFRTFKLSKFQPQIVKIFKTFKILKYSPCLVSFSSEKSDQHIGESFVKILQ